MSNLYKKKNNDKKVAVALSYNLGDAAPTVIATGKGILADKIIDGAKDNDIPLYEDGKLAKTLSKLDLGETIPPELYSVVAEVLVFVDRMDKIKSKVLDKWIIEELVWIMKQRHVNTFAKMVMKF